MQNSRAVEEVGRPSRWAAIRAPELLPLFFIVGLGLVVRMWLLNQPMRHDETQSFLDYASQPLVRALTIYSAPNNHLFHTLLVHLTTFGGRLYVEWLIRLPAFLAGTAVIFATYVVGRKLFNAKLG